MDLDVELGTSVTTNNKKRLEDAMNLRKAVIVAVAGLLVVGCSGEPKAPTCDVYVSGNQIHVVIELPEEGMDYHDRHDLTQPGISGTPSRVEVESGGSSIEYSQTGNTYTIAYTLVYAGGDIESYDISIKGDVYGDTEHTCTK